MASENSRRSFDETLGNFGCGYSGASRAKSFALQLACMLVLLGIGACYFLYNRYFSSATTTLSVADAQQPALKATFVWDDVFLTNGQFYVQFWQVLHFLYYFIFTMIFPDCWFLLWATGFIWEATEHFLGWAMWSDVAYNTAGVALGLLVRRAIDRFDARARLPTNAVDARSVDEVWQTRLSQCTMGGAVLAVALWAASFHTKSLGYEHTVDMYNATFRQPR